MIDKTAFFMESTLRVCSTLNLEDALKNCLLYLKDFMPADIMMFYTYDYDQGIFETVAYADHTGKRSFLKRFQFPAEVRDYIKKNWKPGSTLYIEKLSKNFMSNAWAEAHNMPEASAILMDLMLEEEELGMVAIMSGSGRPFTDEHIRLIEMLNKPFAITVINALRYRELNEMKNILEDDNQYLQNELKSLVGKEVVGADMGLKTVMDSVKQVSNHDSPVLLLGETGTGKEVIANAIHNLSNRKNGPFIKVNCGAIPGTLIDSELFGHEKGAFTGAFNKKRGRFERANGGTLFLDEIGELSLDAQVRLLRILQEKEIERVGGSTPIKVDIRIITATHRNLESMRKAGTFRDDLYYRIKIFPIVIPPLRERIVDIPILVHYLIQKKSQELNISVVPKLETDCLDQLMAYNWPGNIRELENVVERALIINKGGALTFQLDSQNEENSRATDLKKLKARDTLNLDQLISKHIKFVLKITGGKVEGTDGAASLLGVRPNTLRHRMRKLGVPFGRKHKVKKPPLKR